MVRLAARHFFEMRFGSHGKRAMENGAAQPHKTLSSEHGFSIVSAIFLLVVLSAMGAFMLTFSNVQQMTSAQDLQGAKAYQAARGGIDWGAYQILQNGGACAASTAVPLGGNLSGFALTVNCARYGPYTEGISTVTLYQITATARSGTLGSTTYVERQLQATIAH